MVDDSGMMALFSSKLARAIEADEDDDGAVMMVKCLRAAQDACADLLEKVCQAQSSAGPRDLSTLKAEMNHLSLELAAQVKLALRACIRRGTT